MDPFTIAMMLGQAVLPEVGAALGGTAMASAAPFLSAMGNVKMPETQTPPMSGGVSGTGAQPFLQSFNGDIFNNSLSSAFSRMGQSHQQPGLGQILAGAR